MTTNAHASHQPQNFDWRVFLLLNEVKDSYSEDSSSTGPEATNRIADTQDLDSVQHPYPPEELNRMKRAGIIASVFSVIVGLVTWVVWPLPLYRDYIFSKSVSLVIFFLISYISIYFLSFYFCLFFVLTKKIIVLLWLDGCFGNMALLLPARCVCLSHR